MIRADNSVLYIAYPMLPVTEASCGGAEQMLWSLEREMHARGWRTAVAACDSSRISGELLATGTPPLQPDRFDIRQAEHRAAIFLALRHRNFDLLHDKSGHWKYTDHLNAPVLVTLHLPRSFYSRELFQDLSPNVFFNCVSTSQAESFQDLPGMLGVVRNGIALDKFPFIKDERCDYLLWLGRICPEKGPHLAIEVAQRAGMPLVIAGAVYPFSYHQQYFEAEVKPHIQKSNGQVRFVESPDFDRKVQLLRNAKALILPTLAPETSSLVCMEAMACGTPAIALRRGAISEVVVHGETGFIVDSVDGFGEAISRLHEIKSSACRAHVEASFSSLRMANEYELLYEQVLAKADRAGLAA